MSAAGPTHEVTSVYSGPESNVNDLTMEAHLDQMHFVYGTEPLAPTIDGSPRADEENLPEGE
jgi:hypothetical protein